MRNSFYKNLYQTISFFSSFLILLLPLLAGFIVSLNYDNNASLLLVFAVILAVLCFSVGSYWMFQRIIIDENGIGIYFFKKRLRFFHWEDIFFITKENRNRTRVFRLYTKDPKPIYLSARKKIKDAIEKNSVHRIKTFLCEAQIAESFIIEAKGSSFQKKLDTDRLVFLWEEVEKLSFTRMDTAIALPAGECVLLRFENGEFDVLAGEFTKASPEKNEAPPLCRSWLLCPPDDLERIKKYFS